MLLQGDHQEDSWRVDNPAVDLQDHEVDIHRDQGGIQSSEHLVETDLQGSHHIVHHQDTQDLQGLHIGRVQVHCIQGHHWDNQDHHIQALVHLHRNCSQVHSLDQVGHQLMVVQTLEDRQDLAAWHQAFHRVEALDLVGEADSAGFG